MDKTSWLFWGIFIVCVGIIAEICVLFLGNFHHSSPTSTFPSQVYKSYATTQGSLNVTTLPAGFFLLSDTHTELLFAAKLESLSDSSDGIHAKLSFFINNSTQEILYSILLVPKNSSLLLVKRNIPDLFSPSGTTKQIFVPFTDVVSTLKPYLGEVSIFSFVLIPPKIGQRQLPTTNSMHCNQQFSTYLTTGQQAPSCLPSPESITIYEKF